ncbi:MAG: hypothetical protein QOE23_2577 [Pseudonocardiales bacterium]|jgi:hypothetical protein|nr:hypothetical protein [Pseudonocardiales bacterium]
MTESTASDQPDPAAADDLRQHAQTDVEGGDAAEDGNSDQAPDVPREHTEDPAEG